jgi:hypothetical protein
MNDYPTFHNFETRSQALGLATHAGQVYYLSTAGPGVSIKSIWATLVNGQNPLVCADWTGQQEMSGANPIQSIYAPIPESNYLHLVAHRDQPTLLVAAHPAAVPYHDPDDPAHAAARAHLLQAEMAGVYARFVAILNLHTNVPVLTPWADTLFRAAQQDPDAITPLEAFGDCLAAWLIHADFNWLGLVQRLLQEARIVFPDAPADAA